MKIETISTRGTEIVGGGTPLQMSLKALLQRKVEAEHKKDVRETLGTFIIAVDPDDMASR